MFAYEFKEVIVAESPTALDSFVSQLESKCKLHGATLHTDAPKHRAGEAVGRLWTYRLDGILITHDVDTQWGVVVTQIRYEGERPAIVDSYLDLYGENKMTRFPKRDLVRA